MNEADRPESWKAADSIRDNVRHSIRKAMEPYILGELKKREDLVPFVAAIQGMNMALGDALYTFNAIANSYGSKPRDHNRGRIDVHQNATTALTAEILADVNDCLIQFVNKLKQGGA